MAAAARRVTLDDVAAASSSRSHVRGLDGELAHELAVRELGLTALDDLAVIGSDDTGYGEPSRVVVRETA